jgi:NAD+ kinase
MRSINKIKIYCNQGEKSSNVYKKLENILEENNFEINNNNPDLIIAIGGDGAFLRSIKAENYNSNVIYVGINSGTLGFLQEIEIKDLEKFIQALNNNNYLIEEVGIQEADIKTDDKEYKFYSLNEIVIREKELNTAHMKILINNNLLERFAGDGLLISTSVGSTAYNLSFGGSVVYNIFHTLQITPIAPLNSKVYRNLLNSVIVPEKFTIKIMPAEEKKNLLLSIDGENIVINNVQYIKTKVEDKRLKFLKFKKYNYWRKINKKFLSN